MKYFTLAFGVTVLLAAGLFVSSCRGKHDHATDNGAERKAPVKYHCPMHPTYISDRPGDCPICGMRLVPMETEPAASAPASTAAALSDHVAVTIPAERQQLIGVRVEPAARRTLDNLVRASGRVAYDPELYMAIVEYNEAIKSAERVKDSQWPDVKERSEALLKSARLRLRQMGLSDDNITALASQMGDPTNLLLGQAGEDIWVYAQIYEFEAPLVKVGQKAEISLPGGPGQKVVGTVRSVDSIVNSETRTIKARILVNNRSGSLKPEMYVDVAIRAQLGQPLTVPADAVVDTGTRQLVFVETAPGRFEPRDVSLGAAAGGFRVVLSGLAEGEKVVSSGTFLVDSESKLKAAVSQSGHQH